jgi:hypothetical protein
MEHRRRGTVAPIRAVDEDHVQVHGDGGSPRAVVLTPGLFRLCAIWITFKAPLAFGFADESASYLFCSST